VRSEDRKKQHKRSSKQRLDRERKHRLNTKRHFSNRQLHIDWLELNTVTTDIDSWDAREVNRSADWATHFRPAWQ